MNKFYSFALMLGALLMSANVKAQSSTLKFDATITSGSTVQFQVAENYKYALLMPAQSSCSVNPASVTINVKMHDVASLDIQGDREAESTIETGVVHGSVNLSSWLGNIYNFGGATMPIEVISRGETFPCQYNIAAFTSEFNAIIGTPANEQAMRTAWWEITSHVTPSKQVGDDSYMTLAKGSYLQMGDERLEILQNFDLCKGQWTIEGLMNAFVSATNTKVSQQTLTDQETYKTILFFEKGSILALGETLATLDDACTVTFDCTAAYQSGSSRKTGIITNLMDGMKNQSVDGKVYTTMVNVVNLLNEIVGQVDAAGNVPATVEFDNKWKVIRGENSLIVGAKDHALAMDEIGTFVLKQAVDSIRGGIVYDIDSRVGAVSNATALDLVEAEYPLIAGRPYIFKASADKLEGVLSGDEVSTAGDFNGLIGKYEKFDVPATDASTIWNFMIYQNKAQLCGAGCYIYGGMAYINMNNVSEKPVAAPGRKHFIMGGNATATSLENMTIVPAEGVQKMMVGGKFIIVKDGKMFNAQGAAL